jgi:hypothetical protein
VAGFQTLARADQTARDQGAGTAPADAIAYLSLPGVPDAPPPATAAPPARPSLLHRIRDALIGRASAENTGPAAVPTPGAKQ